jgi:hypothetical protein
MTPAAARTPATVDLTSSGAGARGGGSGAAIPLAVTGRCHHTITRPAQADLRQCPGEPSQRLTQAQGGRTNERWSTNYRESRTAGLTPR